MSNTEIAENRATFAAALHATVSADSHIGEQLQPLSVVKARTSLGSTTIWRHVREGIFPAPYQITPTRVGWRKSDIDQWIEARRPVAWAAQDAAA